MPFVGSVVIIIVLVNAPSSGSVPVSVGTWIVFVPPGFVNEPLFGVAVGVRFTPKFALFRLVVVTLTLSLLSAVPSSPLLSQQSSPIDTQPLTKEAVLNAAPVVCADVVRMIE